MLRGTAAVTVVGTGGALTYAYLYDEGVWRTLRVLNSLIPMGVDYWRLVYHTSSAPEDARRAAFDAYHEKWRDEPLRVCLDLRGFYVKVGQLCAGFPGDGLPPPYRESLKVLQENVPPQPIGLIRRIVESELGCPLEAVFAEFEAEPIGAASIGQVHRARLLDGTDVVCKVQYPECERHFRLDFTTIKSIFLLVNKVLLPVLDAVEEGFAAEFDYRLEAANLRRMVDEVLPLCKQAGLRITVPAPYDERHPNLPPSVRRRGASLTTKRLMVMDRCAGSSLSKVGRRLLTDYAAAHGQTADEYAAHVKRRMLQEPGFLDKLLRQAAPTQRQLRAYRWALRLLTATRNGFACLYNWTVGWVAPRIAYASARPAALKVSPFLPSAD